jgi:hypothetical protein
MLVVQFSILPIATGIGEVGVGSGTSEISSITGIGLVGTQATPEELTRPFLWLLITQGFFIGLVIGKLSEGKIKSGLKHSFILVLLALLISTGAKVFLG